jgi:parallel beta-helix repeat protein
MNRPDRTSPWTARAFATALLLLGAGQAGLAHADTVCVNTVNEFLAAFEDVADQDQTINVVSGTYTFTANPGNAVFLPDHRLTIVGGWNADCTSRQADPRLTVFTGPTASFGLSHQESIEIESITFTDFGRFSLLAREWATTETIHLKRVWFENVCGDDGSCATGTHPNPPDMAVFLWANRVHLSHVVMIDQRDDGCAVHIHAGELEQATVSFSLFTGNDGDGLCVIPSGEDDNPEYELSVQNSIFWNNAQDDIVTRQSPRLILKNNIYQSTDSSPAPESQPLQNLNVDPQFQNAAGHDFRLQPSSPAINSGRFGTLIPDHDLDGGARVIGPAPDRGPFESPSTESTFQVTNTLDTTSPVATGSLRWAIEQANANPGLDRIRFALPDCPRIIELNALLPDITDSVFIDGYSQAGSARNESVLGFAPTLCVGLRDSSLALDHALRIPAEASDSTLLWVSGLAFGGFDLAAVRIAAGSGSWIFGNQFGGSLGGTALGNNAVNVRLGGTSHDNLVGGSETSQRNLIGSAYVAGVELLDNGAGAEGHDNTVRNNLIGLDGTTARPNALGVRVRSHRNRIEDNFISGNQGDGVLLEGSLAFENEIRDNAIGLKTIGFCLPPCTTALGNSGAGVRLAGGGRDNVVRYNRIRNNGGAGVRLEDGRENLLFSNSISANGALGIDLGAAGPNPVYNSGLAITAGYANRGLNAPTLLTASGSGSGGRVTGQVVSHNGVHLVEIFRNASCDASGRGEGLQSLTAGVVTISNALLGDNGSQSFDFALPADAALDGATLTAVAKDSENNSSEFSACLAYATVPCRELFRDGLEDNPPPPACTPP